MSYWVAFEQEKRAANNLYTRPGIGRPNMKNTVWTTQAVCLLGLLLLSGCASTIPSPIAPTRLGASQDQATVQALHKRLQERERTISIQNYKIDVMSSQLDALKRIDQDMTAQRRPVRNSMTVAP